MFLKKYRWYLAIQNVVIPIPETMAAISTPLKATETTVATRATIAPIRIN